MERKRTNYQSKQNDRIYSQYTHLLLKEEDVLPLVEIYPLFSVAFCDLEYPFDIHSGERMFCYCDCQCWDRSGRLNRQNHNQ